jgi:hypothetical protein
MRTARILTVLNGVGLQRDTAIVKELLVAAGIEVYVTDIYKNVDHRHVDINIHLEIVSRKFLHKAHQNWLIPNPEWFQGNWVKDLKYFNKVLCKTHDAEDIFKRLGCKTVYTSFTSEDRRVDGCKKQRVFFHNQGKSDAKNTDAVLGCWRRFVPPATCVVVGRRMVGGITNVHHAGYMNEDDFRMLQNTCMFHLCPSQYEGFGHYIWEALSCGNVVVTTDAEPMNEFIRPGFGLLVKADDFHMQNLGKMWHVSPANIHAAVTQVLKMKQTQIDDMGALAREAWESNDKFFKERFLNAV